MNVDAETSVDAEPDILDRVQQLAEEAGVQGERNLLRGEFVILYELPNGRTQEVYISDATVDPETTVISVGSTCVVLSKGMFSDVNKAMLLELLLTNEKLNFARYGLVEDEESYIVVASYDVIFEGLAAKSFAYAMECVALTADSYEEKFDQDLF